MGTPGRRPDRRAPVPPTTRKAGTGMDIAIDHDKCMGAGQCALIAPEVFDQDETDGHALLLLEQPGSEHHEAIRDASYSCPLGAITLHEHEHEHEHAVEAEVEG